MTDADRKRLGHILDQIDRIGRYAEGGRATFAESDMVQDAVMRCLSVIGEAASALTEDVTEALASLPPHLPKGMRNRIVHECWRVDRDIVWATIESDLPTLRLEIEAALR